MHKTPENPCFPLPPVFLKTIWMLQALPLILGEKRQGDADYLDTCRVKRNTVEYDRIGATSDGEAIELIAFAQEFRAEVLDWLKRFHPGLL